MPSMSAKWCSYCATWKSIEMFGKNATRPDGLSFYCLDCNRAKSNAHYRKRRAVLGRTVREPDDSPDGFKRCSGCRQVKKLEEFHKNQRHADGYMGYCKPCRKDMARATHLRRMYGLDELGLSELIAAQCGVCAICELRAAVHVDHDHSSGKVRGVLCFRCNVAIGHLDDDPALMRSAIRYLERTGTPQCQRVLVEPGVYRVTSPRSAAAASPSFSPLLRRISYLPV